MPAPPDQPDRLSGTLEAQRAPTQAAAGRAAPGAPGQPGGCISPSPFSMQLEQDLIADTVAETSPFCTEASLLAPPFLPTYPAEGTPSPTANGLGQPLCLLFHPAGTAAEHGGLASQPSNSLTLCLTLCFSPASKAAQFKVLHFCVFHVQESFCS